MTVHHRTTFIEKTPTKNFTKPAKHVKTKVSLSAFHKNTTVTPKNLDHTNKPGFGMTTLMLASLCVAINVSPASATEMPPEPETITASLDLAAVQTLTVSDEINPANIQRDTFSVGVDEVYLAQKAAEAEAARVAAEEAAAAEAARVAEAEAASAAVLAAANTSSSASTKTSSTANKYSGSIPAANTSSIIDVAAQYVGLVPYGSGNTPDTSFSCDGYTQWVYGQVGITLPRTVSAQYAMGTEIPKSEAVAGDLLVWKGQHVGIYDGNGGMYDSPMAGRYVQHRTDMWGSPVYVRIG